MKIHSAYRHGFVMGAMFGAPILMVLGFVVQARGQEHHHPPQDMEIHRKFYSTWNRPNGGEPRPYSCCNEHDCYPAAFKNVGGTWFALRREDKRWVVIPDNLMEHNQRDPRESPDGRNHVCMQAPGLSNQVYCATLGSGQ